MTTMTTPTFSILIPAYKSESIIGETIKSILNQTFADFELIIVDDNSPDQTAKVVQSFKDKRIRFFKNKKNLGYSGNLECCRQKALGKYLYLMGNDDILSPLALELTFKAFQLDPDVGAVTRPYYWFENDDVDRAVRVVRPLDENADRVISIFDGRQEFSKVFESVGQLSALSLRRDWVDVPVHKDIFPAHIYPFLSVFKKYKIVFLKDYVLAVRIFSSQTRSLSSIYEPSPTFTWVRMFETVLAGKKYDLPRRWGINHIAKNYEGLAQMKNYAPIGLYYKEIWILVRYRPLNLLSLRFWFFFFVTTLTPRRLLIRLVDFYKSRVNGVKLINIKLIGVD